MVGGCVVFVNVLLSLLLQASRAAIKELYQIFDAAGGAEERKVLEEACIAFIELLQAEATGGDLTFLRQQVVASGSRGRDEAGVSGGGADEAWVLSTATE